MKLTLEHFWIIVILFLNPVFYSIPSLGSAGFHPDQCSSALLKKNDGPISNDKLSEALPLKEVPVKFSYSPSDLIPYVHQNIQPLSLNNLLSANVPIISFGETHSDSYLKKWLSKNMHIIKLSGITHLGMEMFNSHHQELINNYYRGLVTRESIINVLREEWGWLPNEYMDLIDAAKNEDIQIVALDNRPEAPELSIPRSIFRNNHMANILINHLISSPQDRILLLARAAHIQNYTDKKEINTIPTVLNKKGIHSINYTVDYNDEFQRSLDTTFSKKSLVRRAVEKAKYSGKNLFLPLPKGNLYDGYIFLDDPSSPAFILPHFFDLSRT